MSQDEATKPEAGADLAGRLEPLVRCDFIFGRSELKQFNKFENGRMTAYGYRIDYDRDGNETGRTEPSPLSSIGWDDGSPFTETDYRKLST